MGIDTTFVSDFLVFFTNKDESLGKKNFKQNFKKLKKKVFSSEEPSYWEFGFDEDGGKLMLKETSVRSSPFNVIPELFTIINEALAMGMTFYTTSATTFVDDYAAGIMMISPIANSDILVRVVRTISFVEDPNGSTFQLEYSLSKFNKSDKDIGSIVDSIHKNEIRLQ